MVSRKEIRRKIKEHFKGEVSSECLVYLKETCEKLINDVIEAGVEEFHATNRIRERARIAKLKRITSSEFKNVSKQIFKETPDFKHGEIGELNKKTILSKANIEVT